MRVVKNIDLANFFKHYALIADRKDVLTREPNYVKLFFKGSYIAVQNNTVVVYKQSKQVAEFIDAVIDGGTI